ncbi:MAG TPA: hypothetical protein VK308_15890 [Pyrinomonadaceae bacterium]|nr:hypothetical protein [Pyrinomonadaceae bacterium]
MNNAKAMTFTLFFTFFFASFATAQTSPVLNSNAALQAQTSDRERQDNAANTAHNNNADTNCDNVEAGALIVVADTSPSVKNQLAEIKSRGKEILAFASPCVRFGVVSINWEAVKKSFADKAEADKFIDSLTVSGQYTDLNRGNDAALSLLPSSGKSVIAFMTDGKATVPSTFKNKESFIEILRREYGARPNVRVFVLNVKGEPMAQGETLPANVTIIPIADWQAARTVIAETLAPEIKQQLAIQKTPDNSVSTEEPKGVEESWTSNKLIFAAVGAVALVALAAILIVWRKRRNRLAASQEILLSDQPENILRDEDLQPTRAPEPAPESVLMVEAVNKKDGQFAISPLRGFINLNERLIVGGSRLLAGMHLAELCQSQTLEISFDGKAAGVIRLRPSDGESLDAVLVNEQPAPKSFLLIPNEPHQLTVGGYELRLVITDESMIELFDTSQRTSSLMLGNNEGVAQNEPKLARRRVRSSL